MPDLPLPDLDTLMAWGWGLFLAVVIFAVSFGLLLAIYDITKGNES